MHRPYSIGYIYQAIGYIYRSLSCVQAAKNDVSVMHKLQFGLMNDPDIQEDKGFMDEMQENVVARNNWRLRKYWHYDSVAVEAVIAIV